MALVSVLIACYNAERWIAAAIESALAQRWPDTEVIVVNDGSTDRSGDVVRSFEARGVRVIDQTNRGASAARNAAIAAARGTFVQFLDADDLLDRDKVAEQMQRLQVSSPDAVASAAWARFVSDPREATFEPSPNARDLSGVEFLQLHYEEGCMMHPAAWLVPRAVIERVGPWNEQLSLNDDGEYFARVVLASSGIVFCPAAKSYYRSDVAGSLSRRKDRRALESLYRSTELMTSYLLDRDGSERSRSATAHAWKWTAFELYPGAPDLSRAAERRSRALGGSRRRVPTGRKVALASKVLGWRTAKRLLS